MTNCLFSLKAFAICTVIFDLECLLSFFRRTRLCMCLSSLLDGWLQKQLKTEDAFSSTAFWRSMCWRPREGQLTAQWAAALLGAAGFRAVQLVGDLSASDVAPSKSYFRETWLQLCSELRGRGGESSFFPSRRSSAACCAACWSASSRASCAASCAARV